MRSTVAVLMVLAICAPVRPSADDLSLDLPVTAGTTGAALLVWGATELAKERLTPPSCRWCRPPGLDREMRAGLRWSNTGLADGISDGLVVAIPISLLAWDLLFADGGARRAGEDALVVLQAIAAAGVAAQAFQYGVARRRPIAWAAGVRAGPDDDNSFISGHASSAFAGAAAFGTVAMIRDYPGWPVMYVVGLVGATAVCYLRVAADKHWLTDVLAGAAVGSTVGVGVPLLHRAGEKQGGERSVRLTFVPFGVVGRF